jgi:hypothetical protein
LVENDGWLNFRFWPKAASQAASYSYQVARFAGSIKGIIATCAAGDPAQEFFESGRIHALLAVELVAD